MSSNESAARHRDSDTLAAHTTATEEASVLLGRLFDRFKKGSGEARRREVSVVKPFIGLCFDFERDIGYESKYLADTGLDYILEALDKHGLRATFSCPAKLCELVPDQIARIAQGGHELAAMGYADELLRDISDETLGQLVHSCVQAFASRGVRPVGFRSPGAGWDDRLCAELVRQGFRYNAEHDHAKHPYELLGGAKRLLRLPMRTDDKGLRRSEDTYNSTVSKHLRVVRKAIQHGHFCAIAFHPWILAEDMERMEHWESWLEYAVHSGATVGPLTDALPAEPGRRNDKGASP